MKQEIKEALEDSITNNLQGEVEELCTYVKKCVKAQNYREARVTQSKIDGINKAIAIIAISIDEFVK